MRALISALHTRGAERARATTGPPARRSQPPASAGIDIFIGAAAVSDYRPAAIAAQKIKKSEDTLSIELTRTRDILASVAALPDPPFAVGFAAETNNLREYALSKLENKRLDMIIANKVGSDCGFDSDENTVDVYWQGGSRSYPMAAKTALAYDLVALIVERFETARGSSAKPAVHT
jgi:phosphopantothenoylcysteine decarboxylase/phosphopantothenate--cysteine ligase